MPSNLVKSYAKKTGKSVKAVEAKWKEAKKAVSKTYDKDENPRAYWGTVNKITRRKLKLEESMKDFVREKELIGRLENGFNCKNDYMHLRDGHIDVCAKVGSEVDFELLYDREYGEGMESLFLLGIVNGNSKNEVILNKPEKVNEFLGNILSVLADREGFGVAREWAEGVNLSNIYKFLDKAIEVSNGEVILDEE